jgi:hypothetical protein
MELYNAKAKGEDIPIPKIFRVRFTANFGSMARFSTQKNVKWK